MTVRMDSAIECNEIVSYRRVERVCVPRRSSLLIG